MNKLLYIKTGYDLVAITATGKKILLSGGDNYSDTLSFDLDTLCNVIDYSATPPEYYPSLTITFTIPNGENVTQTFSPNHTNGHWEKENYCPDSPCMV